MSFFADLDRFGGSTALIDEFDRRVTYKELAKNADSLAKGMRGSRNLVFVFCKNSIPSITAYLACLRSGNVPLLVDEKINPELRGSLIAAYGPNYLIAPSESAYGDSVSDYQDYTVFQTAYQDAPKMTPDLALLLTTSGSTGSPKLVRQSRTNIESNAETICGYLEIDQAQRPITTLPMSYTYGLSIINSHLHAGAAILVTEKTLMQKEFWAFFRANGATSMGGVPYTYEMLKRLRFFDMDLPSLDCLTQAGGKLNYELTKEVATHCGKHGIRFYVMYGQAEATARMSYLPYEKALEKCGSMGIAIPGGTFTLRNGEAVITEPDVPGDLFYEGPNVTLGYAQCAADLAGPDENNGTLDTGDVAKRDGDGYYYIVGRKKRFVKIFGNRVNLDEVEQILKNKGIVCACTGIDDHMMIAVEKEEDKAHVETALPGLLGLNKSAFHVMRVDGIPKNASGKVSYAELLEIFNV